MNASDEKARRTEELLVLRAQLGDQEAFAELYRQLSPKLLRYIAAIVRDATAEDVLQEVFVIIYRKLLWLDDPASLQSWAYRVAGREAVRAATKRRRRSEIYLTEGEWDTLQKYKQTTVELWMSHETATRELRSLPPASRAILTLHYIEDLPIREAAEILNIPVGTAKSRLAFGIDRLRQRLGLEPGNSRERKT